MSVVGARGQEHTVPPDDPGPAAERPDDEGPARRSGRGLVVVLVVTVVALAVIGLVLDRATEGTAGLPPPLQLGPVSSQVDGFAASAPAGASASALHWAPVRGVWALSRGEARVLRAAPVGPSMALVDVGSGDGLVQVTGSAMEPGLGLAFRCRGPANCWWLESAPSVGTWTVHKVVGGRASVVGNLGTVPIDSGTTVAVEMRGKRLRFSVDGAVARTFVDGALVKAHRAGPSIQPGPNVTAARWTDFHAATGLASSIVDGFDAKPVRGVWALSRGEARVLRAAPVGPSMALVDVGSGDGKVAVTGSAMEPGLGLAFRCRGPANCWWLESAPSVGTWTVHKVVGGRASVVGNLGTVPIDSGTTVAVEMQGKRLRFSVDGVVARTFVDGALVKAHRAGPSIQPGPNVTAARWTDFHFGPAFRLTPVGTAE